MVAVVTMAAASFVPRASAGCGCEKPPPLPAEIRPHATYAGAYVTLFSSAFQVGQVYAVDFSSGTSTAKATVTGTVVSGRDIADAVAKPQLTVAVPALPLGPTSLSVRVSNLTTPVLIVNDDEFTVVPQPIVMSQTVGSTSSAGYQAAVSRDGTVYISLDVSGVRLPRVFQAQAKGYPLRFTSSGVSFYNTQGFLMQQLSAKMPGLYTIASPTSTADSDILGYSRHEFNTFYLQHVERQEHKVIDGAWHADGTRHIDHDHLVLAVAGTLANGARPAPGATPPFTLVLNRFSLFHQGLVGIDKVDFTSQSYADSYAPGVLGFQSNAEVLTNGTLSMSGSAVINGNATAASFNTSGSTRITGSKTVPAKATTFMPLQMPAGLPSLGKITVNGPTKTITGPGSFRVSDLIVQSGQLFVDNAAGPVTLYVTNVMSMSGSGVIAVADPDPEKFAVYVVSSKQVALTGGGNTFTGVVYAPYSVLAITGAGHFYGSLIAKQLKANNQGVYHYDSALRGN
jgi:hypothetical protein